MKNICIVLLAMFIICTISTACTKQQKQPLIQSKRRFAEYVEPQQSKDSSVIDLSEGPRLKYEADFGPNSPSFEVKIVDPY